MKCFVFLSLLLSVASATTTSDILLGNWQVITQAGITCNQANCCCFNGAVNGYLLGAENYLNGTAAGVCRKATQQDNIDAPPGYVFTEEFLGIDNCHFTLSNLTYNNQFGISLTMNATGTSKPTCGFQIFRPSASGLPATPDTTTPAPTLVPSYVQAFLGTWYADSTCPADSASCCCLTGTLNISVSTTQASAFLISGTPSAGCGLNTATETDDFVWPVDAYTADVGYNVTAFLVTADDYIVDYSAGMNGAANTILFKDVTRPQCSMKIASVPPSSTTTPPTTPPKNQAHHIVPGATIFTAFIVTLLY